jgi:hypothetical protein
MVSDGKTYKLDLHTKYDIIIMMKCITQTIGDEIKLYI